MPQRDTVQRVTTGLCDDRMNCRVAGNPACMVRAGCPHLRHQLAQRLPLRRRGVACSKLRGLQFNRTPRFDYVCHAHLRRIERIVEHLRQYLGINRLQARAASAFDLQDAQRRQGPVSLAHAAPTDLEVQSDLNLARHHVAGAQTVAIDEGQQMAGNLGR
jgi:hypothetical protein